MKKTLLLLLTVVLSLNFTAKADEGMWLPLFVDRLNYEDMEKMGLRLTAEEIYSINNSSLKDAIIVFGGGCTGEIISDQGLILTNHHCGYGNIQAHSTVEHDYLKDGFWAYSKEEELANPGLKAKFLVRIEDVTSRVLAEVNDDMNIDERAKAVRAISSTIQKEATEGTHYDANVKSFFAGNEFYLFVYETFTDVRLVGAPPSSIGKFGADTDNWMWPRHTGDFSLFRVYAGPDGKPAEYAKENVPFKPRHSLPINISGVEKGDFAMIMGNPGSTDRYLTSFGVDQAIEEYNPTVVKIREEKLRIMREDMDASDKVRIQYASKYARTANYWKYYIGQTKGLKRLDVAGKKRGIEADLAKWIDKDTDRKAKYGTVLSDLEESIKLKGETLLPNIYFREAIYGGSEIIKFAGNFRGIERVIEDEEKMAMVGKKLEEASTAHFKDYNLPTDKKLLASMLNMFYNDIPVEQHPEALTNIHKKFKGDFNKFADKVFEKSIFATPEKVTEFLAKPSIKKLHKDPAYKLMNDFFGYYYQIAGQSKAYQEKFSPANRKFVAALREMNPNKKYYPDANFTMRLTYGQVLDYYPSDAVHFNYFTTMAGIMEKEDPNNWEFVVPAKLKELYENKDFGRYGEGDVMKVCFLTNHDITGGNSGSPVINAEGHLIGLAFDGNWEAMSGDIAFEPELQRTINVDARYVLFIIDKFAGATNLIDEMNIITEKVKKPCCSSKKCNESKEAKVETPEMK
jgi:hypothetical protein